MSPAEHAAEAERLLAMGQVHLTETVHNGIDDSADLAGLHFDKAAVHASLAIAGSLAAIVKTDDAVEALMQVTR